MQLTEQGSAIEFVLRTEVGEVTCGALSLQDGTMWWEGLHGLPETLDNAGCAHALHLMICATVRDFLVVETREAIFGQTTKRRPWGRAGRNDPGTPRIVYLPRVRYLGDPDLTKCKSELNQGTGERRAHSVRPHLRKCNSPSADQVFLAGRYGVALPSGYTFVRPHERGKVLRDTIYRSRSALRCLYQVQERGVQIKKIAWFEFERDVYRAMERLGFTVEHVAAGGRGDRGVDVYATKGTDLDRVSWVIQCKCYEPSRKIGPNLLRELVGTIAEYPRGTRAMMVTTSTFTREARDLARRHDIRIVEGSEFVALLGNDKLQSEGQ